MRFVFSGLYQFWYCVFISGSLALVFLYMFGFVESLVSVAWFESLVYVVRWYSCIYVGSLVFYVSILGLWIRFFSRAAHKYSVSIMVLWSSA